jgi:succinoglycan biosynthesis protein ExoM
MTVHHISVCVCTFKREELLKYLLESLKNQQTEGRFTYSVVVADNDHARSAEHIVTAFSNTVMPVTYCVEPNQNIAMVRNRAIQAAKGDLVAFIDDDEFPVNDWLLNLFSTLITTGASAILGPVRPHFKIEPPRWAIKGKFFERQTYPTGTTIRWNECRTGNVLFNKAILDGIESPFRAEFDTAGEDVDFFRRMSENGRVFVWCDEAAVYEDVPPSRCTRKYLLKRALLRGSNFSKHPKHRFKNCMKSLIAVPCYTLALPILALFGQSVFLKYLIRLTDHGSRLLAFVGLKLTTGRQI